MTLLPIPEILPLLPTQACVSVRAPTRQNTASDAAGHSGRAAPARSEHGVPPQKRPAASWRPARYVVYELACALPPSPARDRIIEVCVQAEREAQARARAVVEGLCGDSAKAPRRVPR